MATRKEIRGRVVDDEMQAFQRRSGGLGGPSQLAEVFVRAAVEGLGDQMLAWAGMAAATPPPSNAPITNTVRIQPMSGLLMAIVASPYLSPVGRTPGGDVRNDQAASDDQNVTIARVVMPEPIRSQPTPPGSSRRFG